MSLFSIFNKLQFYESYFYNAISYYIFSLDITHLGDWDFSEYTGDDRTFYCWTILRFIEVLQSLLTFHNVYSIFDSLKFQKILLWFDFKRISVIESISGNFYSEGQIDIKVFVYKLNCVSLFTLFIWVW